MLARGRNNLVCCNEPLHSFSSCLIYFAPFTFSNQFYGFYSQLQFFHNILNASYVNSSIKFVAKLNVQFICELVSNCFIISVKCQIVDGLHLRLLMITLNYQNSFLTALVLSCSHCLLMVVLLVVFQSPVRQLLSQVNVSSFDSWLLSFATKLKASLKAQHPFRSVANFSIYNFGSLIFTFYFSYIQGTEKLLPGKLSLLASSFRVKNCSVSVSIKFLLTKLWKTSAVSISSVIRSLSSILSRMSSSSFFTIALFLSSNLSRRVAFRRNLNYY